MSNYDYETQQKDAESANWYFIGNGKRLHAFELGCNYSLCLSGPGETSGHVWVDAEPCKICLRKIRERNDAK